MRDDHYRAASELGVRRRWGDAGVDAMRRVDLAVSLIEAGDCTLEEAAEVSGASIGQIKNRFRHRKKRNPGMPASSARGNDVEHAVALVRELGFSIVEAANDTGVREEAVRYRIRYLMEAGADMGMYEDAKARARANRSRK